ncbi:MAG: hypothetical protein GY929_08035 [Actinomycetia bacterium]|nr:hypothetical protein [Actinomycetes bacterium]
MPRPLRIQYPGAWYHVFNRGARRQRVFSDPLDRQNFLDLMEAAVDDFGFEIHAYCLMGNHYHLLVRTPMANLSVAMKDLIGFYTQAYNRRHGVDGALFRGRFQSVLVDHDRYLLWVSRYIHRNPLEAGLAGDLSGYRWSSFPAYVGGDIAPAWLHTQETLDLAGSRERYQLFVETGGPNEELADFYGKKRLAPVLGSDEFKASLAA